MKKNTVLFLQNIIYGNCLWRVMRVLGYKYVKITYHNIDQRIFSAKKQGVKFGFVVKKLRYAEVTKESK